MLRCMSLLLARNGHAEVSWRCPLLGEQRKTFALIGVFRFGPDADIKTRFAPFPFPWLKPILWSVLSLGGALRRRSLIKVISGGAGVWTLSARARALTMPGVGYISTATTSGDSTP